MPGLGKLIHMKRRSRKIVEAVRIGSTGLVGAVVLGALFGAFAGAAGYTAQYAKATSYLSDDPKACVNCHIMNDQFNAWSSASHHARAVCNDCHVPHDSLASKYYVKAEHGYRHSKGFTFQNFHEPIQMTEGSREAVIDNCVRCHDTMTHEIRMAARGDEPGISGGVDCIHCHASVAHGPTR
jgi:cytochrome c nitrite reductase small subunit